MIKDILGHRIMPCAVKGRTLYTQSFAIDMFKLEGSKYRLFQEEAKKVTEHIDVAVSQWTSNDAKHNYRFKNVVEPAELAIGHNIKQDPVIALGASSGKILISTKGTKVVLDPRAEMGDFISMGMLPRNYQNICNDPNIHAINERLGFGLPSFGDYWDIITKSIELYVDRKVLFNADTEQELGGTGTMMGLYKFFIALNQFPKFSFMIAINVVSKSHHKNTTCIPGNKVLSFLKGQSDLMYLIKKAKAELLPVVRDSKTIHTETMSCFYIVRR